MYVTFRHIAGALLVSLGLPTAVQANTPSPTHEYTLKNGLHLIVREDHRAPVVVSQLWYKVGSSYEPAGITGVSHALEHMMFKGSSKLGPGESSRVLRELGAEENAFTSNDYTAYYQVLASDRLEVALEMEADRLASLALPGDEFLREIEVIKEERRLRTEDNPMALARERFEAVAYSASGYANPTIGWEKDLKRLEIEDLRAWHKDWYSPNNTTLVVVGDVNPETVWQLADKHFASIPARPILTAKAPLEPEVVGERRLKLHVNTKLPSLFMGFNVPGLGSAHQQNPREVHALRLIAALLDGGNSARLAARLEREQQVATATSAHYDPFTRGDSLFVLAATPTQGKTLEQAEAALWGELERLQRDAPKAEELERVRAQVIAERIYERDSITSQATTIGVLETVGLSWRLADEELDALRAVTAEDIQSAARRLFQRERMTLAQVLPQEKAQ